MQRLIGLSILFTLAACDTDSPTLEEEVDALLDASIDLAVHLCACDDEDIAEACLEAAEDVFDDDVSSCVQDVAASDPEGRENMRCSTEAIEELMRCYEAEGICPEQTASGSTGDEETEDEPISEDACGLAFEDAIDACGTLPAATQDALDDCFSVDGGTTEAPPRCDGDECE